MKAKCLIVEKLSELWYMEYYAAIKNHVYVAYVVKWSSVITLKLCVYRKNEGKDIHKLYS